MRGLSSEKGVAEIIAALLLVCITLSAGIMLAVYASGLMGRLDVPRSQPYTDQLTLDYYNWPIGSPAYLYITVRNDGASTLTFGDFFIQGLRNTTDLTPNPSQYAKVCPTPNPYVLSVQSSCTLQFQPPSGLTVTLGTAYTVKLVAMDGTIFTFSCVYGSYTH
jgi:flagellin-like protein